MCPLDDIEHRRGRGRSVVQAQAPYREVVPDGVDRRFVAVHPSICPLILSRRSDTGQAAIASGRGLAQTRGPPGSYRRPGRLGCWWRCQAPTAPRPPWRVEMNRKQSRAVVMAALAAATMTV